MPRTDSLDAYVGRLVRAIMFDSSRFEGILQAVSHQDLDDMLVIRAHPIRLGKITQLSVIDEGPLVQIWPEVGKGEVVDEPEEESPEAVIYSKALELVRQPVVVSVGSEKLLGMLEALSPRSAASGPVLHLGRGEGETTLVIQLAAVLDIVEDLGEPEPSAPFTAAELEDAILSDDVE